MLGEVFVVEKQDIAVVKKGIDVVKKKRYRRLTWSVRLSRSCLSTGTIKATSAPVQWESCNDDHHNFEEGDHGVGGDVDVEDVKDDIYGEDNSVVKVKL